MSDGENEAKIQTSTIFIIDDACWIPPYGHEVAFMQSVSEIDIVSTARNDKNLLPEERLPFNLHFGRITLHGKQEVVYLFAVAGNQDPHRVLKGFLERPVVPLKRILGFIVIEDSSNIRANGVEAVKELAPNSPCVVAVINQDKPDALPLEKIRDVLNINTSTKLVGCNPNDRQSVKQVLLELLDKCQPSAPIQRARETFQHL
jgi:signal recognition particle receptor subunit beta